MTILPGRIKITNGDFSYLLCFLNSIKPQAVALTPPPCWAFVCLFVCFQFNGQLLDFFLLFPNLPVFSFYSLPS